jgi:hypothetical protein
MGLSLYCLICHFQIDSMSLELFAMILSFLLVASEIWYFSQFRYIGFISTIWGKGFTFLGLGFCVFYPGVPVAIAGSCVMWLLALFYFVLYYILETSPRPLMEKCRRFSDLATHWLDISIEFLDRGEEGYGALSGSPDRGDAAGSLVL